MHVLHARRGGGGAVAIFVVAAAFVTALPPRHLVAADQPDHAGPDACSNAAELSTVVRENCLPGSESQEWDVSGAGDHSLQGFADDISYPAGGEAHFYVSSTRSDVFRADIYRLGYYGGAGARRVASLEVEGAGPQPDCLWEPHTLLYDCANWRRSFSWAVPPDAVSGLYFARLVRPPGPSETWRADGSSLGPAISGGVFSKTGAAAGADDAPEAGEHAYGASGAAGRLRTELREPHASHVWFVVRNDERRADLLFQTSDTTWQAYNRWGGVSTYGGSRMGHGVSDYGGQALDPEQPGRRAFKVSYNRPLVTRDFRAINMPLGAEYPMIRFLEKHGYDVNYVAGVDTHRAGDALLARHAAFLSVGHDEYWSGPQRAAVERARDDAGLHLLFLSGNEVFWRIRWEDDHRTMVCYKESQADAKLDPVPGEWTGTFRDARTINPLGAAPENALTGQIFTVNAWRHGPLAVPPRYRSLRFWRHTWVADTPEESDVLLLRGLLGHEWDEDLDNGHRPAGLIHASETAVDNVMYIQDYGATYDSGSGMHHLTLYRAPSGAIVFGAGTVQWSWGLDAEHDGASGVPPERANPYNTRLERDGFAPEPAVQQATVNLLADMGVQPASLRRSPGLRLASPSRDRNPPTAEVFQVLSPEADAELLRVYVVASDEGGGQVAAVEVSYDGGDRWHPAGPLHGQQRAAGRPGTKELWLLEARLGAEAAAAVVRRPAAVLARAVDDSLNMRAPDSAPRASAAHYKHEL